MKQGSLFCQCCICLAFILQYFASGCVYRGLIYLYPLLVKMLDPPDHTEEKSCLLGQIKAC